MDRCISYLRNGGNALNHFFALLFQKHLSLGRSLSIYMVSGQQVTLGKDLAHKHPPNRNLFILPRFHMRCRVVTVVHSLPRYSVQGQPLQAV